MKFASLLLAACMPAAVTIAFPAAAQDVALDPMALLLYPGTYETSGPVLQIARDGDGLVIGPVGRPPEPMKPISQTEFLVERINTRVEIHVENGKVDRITLHRGDRTLEGKRVSK